MSKLWTGEPIVQPETVRVVARVLLDVGKRYDLVVTNAADTHLHSVVVCSRLRAGRYARAVEAALTLRLQLGGFGPAHIVPVRDQAHLSRLVPYVLGQAARHGLEHHSYELSNLTDLLGAREIGAHTRGTVRRVLPRLRRADLLPLLGLGGMVDGSDSRFLREAALRVACSSSWPGRGREERRARQAAVRVGSELGLTPSALQTALRLGRTGVWTALREDSDLAYERAIRLQLGLIERERAQSMAKRFGLAG